MNSTPERSAIFSSCRKYRYELWRRWAIGPACMFIGLNPSTADELHDDPTVRRCIGYAQRWGYAALCMTNLFAFRATDPKVMKAQDHPVSEWSVLTFKVGAGDMEREFSERNDAHLYAIAATAGIVIAAWGTHGAHLGRGKQVLRILPRVYCLGNNADGSPKHPLYLRSDRPAMIFSHH
jgi:hypothetical protein